MSPTPAEKASSNTLASFMPALSRVRMLVLDVDARLDLGLEPFPRDGDRVIADFNEREGVVAVAVRDRSALFTRLHSKECNLCARHDCVGGIGNGTQNFC